MNGLSPVCVLICLSISALQVAHLPQTVHVMPRPLHLFLSFFLGLLALIASSPTPKPVSWPDNSALEKHDPASILDHACRPDNDELGASIWERKVLQYLVGL